MRAAAHALPLAVFAILLEWVFGGLDDASDMLRPAALGVVLGLAAAFGTRAHQR